MTLIANNLTEPKSIFTHITFDIVPHVSNYLLYLNRSGEDTTHHFGYYCCPLSAGAVIAKAAS